MTTYTITTHYSGQHAMIVTIADENEREIASTEAFTTDHARRIAQGYAVLVTKTRSDSQLVLDTAIPENPEGAARHVKGR
ncbi:MAG: hypothetical protein Q7T73_16235 [Beijerinckiaceae bacterium]|nr:hypothetical protein [Beijerinckiaceae bacterium]